MSGTDGFSGEDDIRWEQNRKPVVEHYAGSVEQYSRIRTRPQLRCWCLCTLSQRVWENSLGRIQPKKEVKSRSQMLCESIKANRHRGEIGWYKWGWPAGTVVPSEHRGEKHQPWETNEKQQHLQLLIRYFITQSQMRGSELELRKIESLLCLALLLILSSLSSNWYTMKTKPRLEVHSRFCIHIKFRIDQVFPWDEPSIIIYQLSNFDFFIQNFLFWIYGVIWCHVMYSKSEIKLKLKHLVNVFLPLTTNLKYFVNFTKFYQICTDSGTHCENIFLYYSHLSYDILVSK